MQFIFKWYRCYECMASKQWQKLPLQFKYINTFRQKLLLVLYLYLYMCIMVTCCLCAFYNMASLT